MNQLNADIISMEVQQMLSTWKCVDTEAALRQIISFMDLTTLEATDTDERVENLCRKAWQIADQAKNILTVAAVCVYPPFVATAKKALQEKNVGVASVAGAFPSGQSPLEIRLAEVRYAVQHGANDIDMVISRGHMLAGNHEFIINEVREHKANCGSAHLKVILETGELSDPSIIQKASELAIEGGADFIKTSTGKVQPAATLEAAYVMLHVIKKHFEKTGKRIGFKPAGGIGDADTALKYYALVETILGKDWLNNKLFRIGASRLLDNVLQTLKK